MIKNEKDLSWLVRPSTIRLLWRCGLVILALLTLGDIFIYGHAHFGIEGSFGFYSWYGLVTCIAMVFCVKGLGLFLERKDTYYDD